MRYPKLTVSTIITVFFVAAMAIALVWVRTETIRMGYESARISRDLRVALRVKEKLILEWERITSFAELEKIAREELNLSPPTTEQIFFLEENTHSRER